MESPRQATVLSAELYEEQKRKFIETIEHAREMAKAALRDEFGELVEHLEAKTDGSMHKSDNGFR